MKISFLTIAFFSISYASAEPIGLSNSFENPVSLEKSIPSIRSFPTWETLQPSSEKWNHTPAEELLNSANENDTEVIGIFHQLAPWASSDKTPNGFPLENLKAWANYVSVLADSYREISHWDVLNSYNTGSRQTNTPFHYLELLTIAYDSAKKANPSSKIGFSLANYDLEFLDEALRSGAGKKLDYLSLSPFEITSGSDRRLTSVLPTVRALLTSYDLPSSIPIHITLTGKESDLPNAAALAQSLGFDRVFIESSPAMLKKIPKGVPSIPKLISYEGVDTVELNFGDVNNSKSIIQHVPSSTPWDEENNAARLPITGSPPIYQTSFLVDPAFFSPDQREVKITFHVSRIPSETGLTNPTGFAITYESVHGIITTKEWWPVPGDNEWHTKTYTLTDAAFKGKLGWNFRINAAGAGSDLLIRKVVLTK